MKRVLLLGCLLPVLLLSARTPARQPSAPAGEKGWKAGFGRANVTPKEPVRMSGYSSRTDPFKGVECDLFVKAMVLQDPAGNRAVLVTTDLIGTWGFFTDPVVEAVSKKTGLKPEHFLFTCAHNHSGPAISLDASPRGAVTKESAAGTVKYTEEAQKKLTRAILDAVADLKPATLSWGVGVAPFVMNRREFTERGIILGRNPRAPVDRSVPVLRVDSPEGALRGVVFGCACHNTTLTNRNYLITGDFAGFAQQHIEAKHPGACALFVTGCAGDANPYPRGTMELAKVHGRTLGMEVCRVLETTRQPLNGPLRIATGVARLPFQKDLSREALEKIAAGRQRSPAANARALLEKLKEGEKLPTHEAAPVSVWRFGEGLTVVALSGEVVVDYVYLIEKAVGPRDLWVAAYAHEVMGYITSARVQKEGGYEAKGIYGKGLFADTAQGVYVDTVRELARKVGRPLPE